MRTRNILRTPEVRRWIFFKTGTTSTQKPLLLHPPRSGDIYTYIHMHTHGRGAICHPPQLLWLEICWGGGGSFSKVCPPLHHLGTHQLPGHPGEERGRDILTPPFSIMRLSHLASILRKTGSLKAEENEAVRWSGPDPCPQSEHGRGCKGLFPQLLVVGLANTRCGNSLPGDVRPY